MPEKTPLNNIIENPMYLCLDFDGVIADGADECLIVSWLSWHERSIPNKPEQLLDSISADFRLHFKKLRCYVRHDEHFIAPYIIPVTNNIHSQQEFDSSFAGFDLALVKDFSQRFVQTRSNLRNSRADAWLALHSLYPGIKNIFKSAHKIFIVSGKDTESIIAICKDNNINIDKNQVFGGLSNKTEILKILFTQSKDNKCKMIFCDDNLPNVIESRNLGVKTYWAGWGYHTEEHLQIAYKEAIELTSLSQFLSKIVDTEKL